MLGRILLTLGGGLVVVLFAALFAPLFVQWTDFRAEFEDRASRILGKKVVVHGDVDARILPFPSVTLHDVRVGQDTDGQPQLHAARFSMDMELAPFLSGEARIFDMRIEEPKGRIRVLADGTLDWMRGSRGDIPARTVVLENVYITGGAIDLIDEQSGRTRRLRELSADLSASSLAGPWRGDGYAALDGEAASFTLTTGETDVAGQRVPVRLRLLPAAATVAVNLDGALQLAEGRPAYNGNFTLDFLQEEDETEPVHAPPPGPRVRGGFELTNERIRIPNYRLEVGPLNDPYVVNGEATLDTGDKPEFLLTAEGQQIDVNHLGSAGERAKTGRNAAASAQRRIQAVIDMAAQIPIPQVPGRASFTLPAVVANDTTVRDIRVDVRPAGSGWTVDSFAATFPGRTQVEGKGALRLDGDVSFAGDMLVASNQPSGLADWLSGSVDPAIRQLKTAGFSAKVNLTRDLQRFDDLELIIGPSVLRGNLERQAATEATPSLTMNLAGDEIDLDAMRALGSLITGGDAGQIALDHRVAANLKAERFNLFGVAANKVDTVFTLSDGELSLDHLSVGDLAGAAITASGSLEGSLLAYGGSGVATLKADDPGRFLAMLRNRLPQHPALDRLAGSARWFANTDLNADIQVGGDTNGLSAAVTGTSNGSAVTADVALPRLFELTSESDISLNLRLDNDQSSVLLGQAGLDPLPLGDDGAGYLSLDVTQEGSEPASATLAFETDATQLRAEGAFDLAAGSFASGSARVTLNSQNVEPYLLMTGIGLPQFGQGLPARLDADMVIAPDAIRLDKLHGDIDGNAVASESLELARSGAPLSVKGDLSVDTLDLAWLGEAAYGALTDPATGALSDQPFSLPIFGSSQAELQISAKTFHTGLMGNVTDFAGTLTHRDGNLAIENAAGSWEGGKISGRVAMSNGEGNGIFQTRLTVENADLAPLVWQTGDAPVATGRFNAVIAAESAAKTPSELMASLNGSGELRLSDLVVRGIDPGAFPALLTESDMLDGELTADKVRPMAQRLIRQGAVTAGAVVVPFTVTEGEVRAQNVAAEAGGTRFSGEARIDLLEQALQGNLAVTYAAGDEGLAGGDPTVQLRYSGELETPQVEFDVAPLANFLSLRAFERERRRVESLQASVLEKQRLRREVALYRFNAEERQAARERAEAQERIRLEEERRRAEAVERAEQERAQAAAAGNPGDPQQMPTLTVPPAQEMFEQDLPPLDNRGIQTMPGVQQ